MRTKIILVILGLTVIALGVMVYYFHPVGFADLIRINPYSMTLTASPTSVTADGTTRSLITATLYRRQIPYAGQTVNFSASLGRLSSSSAITNSNGQAKVYLTSSQVGISYVKATWQSISKTISVNFTTPSVTLFSDNFSGTISKWQIVYDGYGKVAIESGELSTSPKVSTTPSETHAALVVGGEATWKDYILTLRMKTISQLRTGSLPNPWEVGWVLFRYKDPDNFYYLIYKPNGVELGKVVNDRQIYLATPTSPKLTLNQWDNYKIVLKGGNIKISINGSKIIDYTDTSSPFLIGKIGLYNEDAHVHFDDVLVTSN